MGRVSENSSYNAINYSVGRTKSKLEDLQVKGSNLKRIQKPSDDPIGNVDLLAIRSKNIDASQYLRNLNYAKAQLQFTENAVEDLSDIINKAKEIAIGQASNLFGDEVREGVAREVEQLRKQALSIANRRFGNKYIFAGHKTLTRPFNEDGSYNGDKNQTRIEVAKDVFVPVNFSGGDIFFEAHTPTKLPKIEINDSPVKDFSIEQENNKIEEIEFNRTPASIEQEEKVQEDFEQKNITNPLAGKSSLFSNLERLNNALLTGSHELVQDILPELDKDVDRLIQVRTKIGSIRNTVDNAEEVIEREKLINTEYRSKIEDADVAELYTDLSRQQNVLNASYKASAQLMNSSLLNFIK
ncbi:MAG: flagellar hook-associated protein FlgL [Bacteriovoracaceae bacterium]|jgi:flagellar hook-associated protein 3 FlgL|nr:flagellar hook-associated protein FlgL [Bacteriovoracaceae bacterium]